jgi:putative flippase GtrA
MPLPPRVEAVVRRLNAAWQRRAVSLKAASFALVGVVNASVDAAVFFLLLGYVTASLVLANVLAWVVAVSGSYVLNSFITFGPESGRRATCRYGRRRRSLSW